MYNTELKAKLAINKSLLKEYSNSEYSRIVYMRDNSEFQIQIFNPYTYTIGANISIDDKSLGNTLIIKPGERVWLERYFSEARKFLFTTYKVNGNSSEVKNAIRKNGEIKIEFFKEKERVAYTPVISTVTYPDNNWYNFQVTCDTAVKSYCNDNAATYHSNVSGVKSLSSCDSYCIGDAETTLGLSSLNKSQSRGISCKLKSDKIETGRVEKGSYSNQNFRTMDIDFEFWPFSTEIIKILPESQKPVFKNDLVKQYCSNCGRKLNQKYKFCPYCGFKVDSCPNNQNQNRGYILEKCPNCGRTVRSNMMECPHCGEILR